MRTRILVLALAFALALTGGAMAAAQTDTKPTVSEPAEKPAGREAPKDDRPQREKPPAEQRKPRPEGEQRKPGSEGERHDKGAKRGPGPGIGHAIHGEILVPVRPAEGSDRDAPRQYETVEFDRGKVVSASDDKLTLARPDGVQVTLTLDESTTFRGASKGSELEAGSPVFAVSKDGVARHVGQPKREN